MLIPRLDCWQGKSTGWIISAEASGSWNADTHICMENLLRAAMGDQQCRSGFSALSPPHPSALQHGLYQREAWCFWENIGASVDRKASSLKSWQLREVPPLVAQYERLATHLFRVLLQPKGSKPQRDLTQQLHAKTWPSLWEGDNRHFLRCSLFCICQLICISLVTFP